VKPIITTTVTLALGCVAALSAFAAVPIAGAGPAPKGDPTAVAAKIIKHNFPECKRVSNAVRVKDESIRAKCDGVEYMVFTVFDKKKNKTHEVALNCTKAKSLLNVDC